MDELRLDVWALLTDLDMCERYHRNLANRMAARRRRWDIGNAIGLAVAALLLVAGWGTLAMVLAGASMLSAIYGALTPRYEQVAEAMYCAHRLSGVRVRASNLWSDVQAAAGGGPTRAEMEALARRKDDLDIEFEDVSTTRCLRGTDKSVLARSLDESDAYWEARTEEVAESAAATRAQVGGGDGAAGELASQTS